MIQLRAQHSTTARVTWDPSRLAEPCLSVSLIGSMLSILVITIDGWLRPGYSSVSQAISDLGVGRRAWLLNMDLIVTGLLFMLFALGFHQAMRHTLREKRLNFVTALFALAGIGILNDGVCTEYNPRDPHALLHNYMHVFGFYIAICALTLAFFLIGARLWHDRRWSHYGRFSLISGLVVLALVVVYIALPTSGADFEGLIERMIVGAAFGWQFVTGYYLLRPRRPLARASANARLQRLRSRPNIWRVKIAEAVEEAYGQTSTPSGCGHETCAPPVEAWQGLSDWRQPRPRVQNRAPPSAIEDDRCAGDGQAA